jgi:hypothetical protein
MTAEVMATIDLINNHKKTTETTVCMHNSFHDSSELSMSNGYISKAASSQHLIAKTTTAQELSESTIKQNTLSTHDLPS